MICVGCKKHRDLNARKLCALCARAGGDSKDLAATIRDRETIRRLSRQVRDLVSDLSDARARAELIEAALASDPPAPIRRRETASGQREASLVVHLSDWHIGEVVDAGKVNGLNRFDLEVADERIARCRSAVDWLLEMYAPRFVIRDLCVVLGGDLITGYIHEELQESNSLSPTEEVLWLLPRIEELLRHLGEDVGAESVTVLTNWGNHGRTTPEKRIATAAENSYEWLLYQLLNRRFAQHPTIAVQSTKSAVVYHQIYDTVIRTIHGDEFSYQGGIGGLTIPLNKAIARWDSGQRADCTWFGHWHTYSPGLHTMGNGSLKGLDTYALKRAFPFERPMQSTALVDSRHGICLPTPIWLESPTDEEIDAAART